jgi:hypothetical protein
MQKGNQKACNRIKAQKTCLANTLPTRYKGLPQSLLYTSALTAGFVAGGKQLVDISECL